MRIKNTPNLQYRDRIGHKSKQSVTDVQFSEKDLRETPLKRDLNDISFKGVFSLYKLKNFNLKNNMSLLEKHVGHAPKDLYEHIKQPNWADIQENIKELADGSVQVRTKNWTRLLMEGVVYPIAELPLHIAKSIQEKLGIKTVQRTAEQMQNRNILQKKMDILNNSDIVNSFNGMMETAEKLKYDTNEVQSASLLTRAMKMFDPKSGNYNGVHERALTRIVTGFIPAFFLANDAYNLSRICDDDPKKAEQEKKTRFNQETKRVLSNAYLQLITLGALSKYINSKKWVFMVVTALTVIATESYSRLSNGKKIHFISKEEAIKLNKKNNPAPDNKVEKQVNTKAEKTNQSQEPSFKGSKVFNAFGLAADMPLTATVDKPLKAAEKADMQTNSKPLLSLSGITKWFATIIIAGFALKYAKKNIKINQQTLGKYFDVISKKYDKMYSKLTQKNYKIDKAQFTQIIDKLKEYDPILGQKFEDVTLKYQKTTKIKSEALNIAGKLRKEGLNDLADAFEHLSFKGKTSTFADIEKNSAAEKFFKDRTNVIIQNNLSKFMELIESDGLTNEATELKNILFQNDKLNIKNYTKAKQFIEETPSLKEFATTFDNRFRVDQDAEILKMFKEAVDALKAKNQTVADELNELLTKATEANEYTFGTRNKSGIKEVADFITQPFKFIWGTITLPYKHFAKPLYNMANIEYKLPQWEKELDAVYNGIKKLTYKPRFIPNSKSKMDLGKEDFARYMNTRINKAFNTATLSSISNSDLSALAKNTSVAATAWFLMCDNHNMVMLKSNGDDKNGAMLKAKERAIQETSRTFWNVLFINLFNDTFRHTFNSSLLGAQAVNTASTVIGEYVNRTFIGMPVTPKSRDEIINKERENITDEGIKGKFFRFMTRLTGKKVLSQREQTQKK